MRDKIENPPAFPSTPQDRSGQIAEHQIGMTLRDWMAGQSLAGLQANTGILAVLSGLEEKSGMSCAQLVALSCYEVADAMLTERLKTPNAN